MPVVSATLMDEKPSVIVPTRPPSGCLAGGCPQTPAKGERLPFGISSEKALATSFSRKSIVSAWTWITRLQAFGQLDRLDFHVRHAGDFDHVAGVLELLPVGGDVPQDVQDKPGNGLIVVCG